MLPARQPYRLSLSLFLLLALLAMTGACSRSPNISEPAAAGQTATLPPGIIALSESPMNWADAVAYCRKQGGTLPRFNNSDSWAWADSSRITHIDGFSAPIRPWAEVRLPSDVYWTGTAFSDIPGYSWVVVPVDGDNAVVSFFHLSSILRVVCVP